MAEWIAEDKKWVVKLVYYGPALSGKTTNLMRLHDRLENKCCGELMTFETKGDRTLFFDLLPLSMQAESGCTVKIKLFTVPGQVAHDATRKAVLSRADGVVFVADSQNDQARTNFESFDNLEKNIGRVGLDFETLPLVVQFNKRDLPDIAPEAEILRRWAPTGLPIFFGVALKGEGVVETFQSLLSRTYRRLDDLYRLREQWQIEERHFMKVLPDGQKN